MLLCKDMIDTLRPGMTIGESMDILSKALEDAGMQSTPQIQCKNDEKLSDILYVNIEFRVTDSVAMILKSEPISKKEFLSHVMFSPSGLTDVTHISCLWNSLRFVIDDSYWEDRILPLLLMSTSVDTSTYIQP